MAAAIHCNAMHHVVTECAEGTLLLDHICLNALSTPDTCKDKHATHDKKLGACDGFLLTGSCSSSSSKASRSRA